MWKISSLNFHVCSKKQSVVDFHLLVISAIFEITLAQNINYCVVHHYVHTCIHVCPLYRFSCLFHNDKLGHCFDKDDPQLTLTTLQLLYQLVQSPSIAELICLHNDMACLPLTCYQCLVDPTPNTNDKDIVIIILFKIRLQVHLHVLVLKARYLCGSSICLGGLG